MGGAEAKLDEGVISRTRFEEIQMIVETCHPREFRPVLFVMPFDAVRPLIVEASVQERAHPMSLEYRVERLPRDRFDMLELEI